MNCSQELGFIEKNKATLTQNHSFIWLYSDLSEMWEMKLRL